MTILVRFLMLVACLPLLQPPGTCVCRGGESGHVAHDDDQTNSKRPADDSHSPGCPVEAGADRTARVEPAQILTADFSPPDASVSLLIEPKRPLRRVFCLSSSRPGAPPLYLQYCSFVI